MAIRPRKRKTFSRFIAPVATLLILGYFGFHAFNGQYGVRAKLAMDAQREVLNKQLAERVAQSKKLEARIKLLREGSMEKDMVDEYVRRQLNMVRDDEIVLMRE